jgi:hypothetical protein
MWRNSDGEGSPWAEIDAHPLPKDFPQAQAQPILDGVAVGAKGM